MKNFKQKNSSVEDKHGHKVQSVDEYMTTQLITFTPQTPIKDVVSSLLDNRITGAPVLEKGKIVGVIDDKDCLRIAFEGLYHNLPVSTKITKDYMSDTHKAIPSGTDVMDAANIFLTTPFKRLLVVDKKGNLVGQISRRDALRAVQEMEWGKK